MIDLENGMVSLVPPLINPQFWGDSIRINFSQFTFHRAIYFIYLFLFYVFTPSSSLLRVQILHVILHFLLYRILTKNYNPLFNHFQSNLTKIIDFCQFTIMYLNSFFLLSLFCFQVNSYLQIIFHIFICAIYYYSF